ncbi:MAG: hypothetical protein JWP88_1263, partial [Flaviaesturariibacter sp.]|nr:hypothetical protein [Flaviaesturariibacter sp.]
MHRLLFTAAFLLQAFAGIAQSEESNATDPALKANQNAIIEKYLKKGAWQYSYFDPAWEKNINAGLAEDSTIAYLWQQKAMPLFKRRKYELGMQYLDQAVRYDTGWLDYRAFIKCIFAKTYRSALADFAICEKKKGNSYVMDHTYDFYKAICYLQLNEYKMALSLLKSQVDSISRTKGPDWVHHLDLFYLGIAYYELSDYDNAIVAFDKAIGKFSRFSDAKYAKGKCLLLKGDEQKGMALLKEAKADFE